MQRDKFKNKNLKNGQSLIEAVVSIGVIVLVLVGLISAVTMGLNNAQFARNKGLATKYAQEAAEWLRRERDSNWSFFYSQAGTIGIGQTFCLPSTSWNIAGACDTDEVIDDNYDIFQREVTLVPNSTDRVAITIRVVWNQGNRPSDIILETYLTKWQ